MSSELLRKAVMILRERAEAAYTERARTPYSDPKIPPVSKAEWGVLVDGYLGGVIGAYCATMHPGVGLALADWLEDEANAAGYHENRVVPAALPLARLIVGEQS